ncbi:YggS family pyridoxal phosphate-dependent enzyme [Candidatus Micrarchaeota archaeon]|nr:YggS family pyridoxal phosphate-dependent enzyme [Candidatus Micrarchaeota archaeon]
MSLEENLLKVKNEINSSALKAGRNPEEIKLIAVTKTRSVEEINEAINLGVEAIGENIVQEAGKKFTSLLPVEKHFVGHLQSNKAAKAAELFDFIQSIDSLKVGNKLNDACSELNKKLPTLIQVNIGEEKSKFGVKKEEAEELIIKITELNNLKIKGLMMIAPLFEEAENSRPFFQKAKKLFEELKSKNIPGTEMNFLSMGMTDDFTIAVEEGASMVRIGRAIFGERK